MPARRVGETPTLAACYATLCKCFIGGIIGLVVMVRLVLEPYTLASHVCKSTHEDAAMKLETICKWPTHRALQRVDECGAWKHTNDTSIMYCAFVGTVAAVGPCSFGLCELGSFNITSVIGALVICALVALILTWCAAACSTFFSAVSHALRSTELPMHGGAVSPEAHAYAAEQQHRRAQAAHQARYYTPAGYAPASLLPPPPRRLLAAHAYEAEYAEDDADEGPARFYIADGSQAPLAVATLHRRGHVNAGYEE